MLFHRYGHCCLAQFGEVKLAITRERKSRRCSDDPDNPDTRARGACRLKEEKERKIPLLSRPRIRFLGFLIILMEIAPHAALSSPLCRRGDRISLANSAFRRSSACARSFSCSNTAGLTVHDFEIGPSSNGVNHPPATKGDSRRFTSINPRPRKEATFVVKSDATKRVLPDVRIQLATCCRRSPSVTLSAVR